MPEAVPEIVVVEERIDPEVLRTLLMRHFEQPRDGDPRQATQARVRGLAHALIGTGEPLP